MISVIEKPKKPIALKRALKNGELYIHEAPKLYIVRANNKPKEEADNKAEQDPKVGLPPQPKEYLKYPDYDWF